MLAFMHVVTQKQSERLHTTLGSHFMTQAAAECLGQKQHLWHNLEVTVTGYGRQPTTLSMTACCCQPPQTPR